MSRNFKYTKSNKALTDEQREFYETNGYLIVKNNVPHELIDEIEQYFIDVCEGKKEGTFRMIKDPSLKNKGYKGQYEISKVSDFLHDETFFKYASFPSVTDVIESIIGPNLVAVHSMLINKPPDVDPQISRHPIHQDLYYFPFRPMRNITGGWTAMEHVDESNGCLYAIPGSHKNEKLYDHGYLEGLRNYNYHGVPGFEDEPRVNLVMEKGDTVFLHPLVLHGSGPNMTKGFRKAMAVHYADTNCYFIDVTGTKQEIAQKELELMSYAHYMMIWKFKSRHIKGKVGSFRNIPSNL